ncbi:MAG: ABC transporter ATP-binding protein [Gammaproteobacteria bacterium]
MLETLRRLRSLTPPHARWGFVVIIALITVEALLEMASVALIPLYVTATLYPETAFEGSLLGDLVPAGLVAGLGREDIVIRGGLLLLAFLLLRALYTMTATYWKARYAYNRARRISRNLFAAYLNAPYTFHLQHNTSTLLRNINQDCLQLATRVLLPITRFFSHLIVFLGIMALLFYLLDARAIACVTAFVGVGVAAAAVIQARLKRLGQEALDERRRVIQSVNEGLGGVAEIQVLRRSAHFVGQLDRALERVFGIQRTVQLLHSGTGPVIELCGLMGLVGITLMLLMDGADSQALIATLSVFAVALMRIRRTLHGMIDNYAEVRHNSPTVDVVHDALAELGWRTAPRAVPAGASLRFERALELDGVGYRFEGAERDSLTDVDLTIDRGQAVGIVGATGSGKSTLLKLLLGLLEPTHGVIRIDGEPVGARLPLWQARIGFVPQELFLVDGTIAENIAFGLESAEVDEGRVQRAAAAAELGGLLARLPQGLDTVVGERGIRLSGGERQRIAIARALYHDPEVLIMDEATSALDNTTEAALIDAVSALKGERTIVMVAHRLSTVQRCDRIVFLSDGRIAASGTFDELRAKNRDFRRMSEA